MNNINTSLRQHHTHEVVHFKINCQISSELIAYYVMSVCANEYKKRICYRDNIQAVAVIWEFNDYLVWWGQICKSF